MCEQNKQGSCDRKGTTYWQENTDREGEDSANGLRKT